MNKNKSSQAFTLLEMAVALVIISIILGGIMIARDLINNSRIRNAIAQIDQMNAAVGTFRNKYNGLPGDLQISSAQSYGLTTMDASGYSSGFGDGNGRIESAVTTGPARNDLAAGETLLIWKQLNETKMLNSGADGFTATTTQIDSTAGSGDYKKWLPPFTLHSGVYAYIYGLNSHYYYIARFLNQTGPSIATATTDGVTQWESKTLDEKIDDGYPTSGRITAVLDMGLSQPIPNDGSIPAASVCVDGTVEPKIYNQVGFFDRMACRLQVRASF